ncbi:hypothetical protein RBB77_03840 [Tunturibacter psychrotolerans]|uniref:VWA domain-containing protein n=1 Tax=Tunturiibacter psychrotolerans TaxID=3069686 RepID=A0AAU7ZT10_9BACT
MISKRKRPSGLARMPACIIALVLTLTATCFSAQSNPEATPAAQPPASSTATPPTPTLRVYTNLKQVPVLVLSHDYDRMKPIDPSGFRISLDSGPLFRPTYVRREGDDPISLAILIDASKPGNELLPSLITAIAALPPDFLHSQDRVSVYAIDCNLIRTIYGTGANPAALADGVTRAMAPWKIRQTQNEELKREKKIPPPYCRTTLPLWDSMSEVLKDLDKQPGRRVLLAITDGEDTGSKTLWKDVMFHAQIRSETVFGLLPTIMTVLKLEKPTGETTEIRHIRSPSFGGPEDKFEQICVNSGGIELQASEHTTIFRLKEFTQMLRERYILEFPRGTNEEAGVHTIAVSYRKKSNLYIAATGITVPVASADERESTKTIQADPSRTPEVGSRKALPKP